MSSKVPAPHCVSADAPLSLSPAPPPPPPAGPSRVLSPWPLTTVPADVHVALQPTHFIGLCGVASQQQTAEGAMAVLPQGELLVQMYSRVYNLRTCNLRFFMVGAMSWPSWCCWFPPPSVHHYNDPLSPVHHFCH